MHEALVCFAGSLTGKPNTLACTVNPNLPDMTSEP